MKVKICGITIMDDAAAAVRAGADFLGFVFFPPSRRYIHTSDACLIAARLREQPNCPTLVGVFVNETADQMARVLDECSLDLAQLSGEEAPALVGDPASPIYGRCFKALQPTSLAEGEADAEWFAPPEPAAGQPTLLLDAYHPALRGGTGQVADWRMAAQLAAKVPGLMLAGGLTPDNVADAVRLVRPFAVDVSSGVERWPGVKDHDKLRRFVYNAKAAAELS